MEYESNTILWHSQRAVQSRDVDLIESIFDEATDSDTMENGLDIESNNENGLPSSPQEEGADWTGVWPLKLNEQKTQFGLGGRRSVFDFEYGSDTSNDKEKHREKIQSLQSESNTEDVLWKHNREDFPGRTVNIHEELRAQRMKLQNSYKTAKSSKFVPPRYKYLLGTSSPVDDDDNVFEIAGEQSGLGEWESDGAESSLTEVSGRQHTDENRDDASASSKATSRLYA